jgi:hypothetical protein
MAYRARAPWSRSVRSSRRSHDRPWSPGEPERRAKGHRCLQINNDGEVREMRDAATVLEIIRERGKRGLPLERSTDVCLTRTCTWLPTGSSTGTREH